jgi:hypothetical protein
VTLAKMTLSLRSGAQHVVWGNAAKLSRLKATMSHKMAADAKQVIEITGKAEPGENARPVNVSIRVDDLAGVEVVTPRNTDCGQPTGRTDSAE